MDPFGLKIKTARKFIKKQQASPAADRAFPKKEIASVAVLAEASRFDAYDFSDRLSRDFSIPKEKIEILLVDPSGKLSEDFSLHQVVNQEAFGMQGRPKTDALKAFLNRDFDLLINYCPFDWVFTEVLVLRSKAKLIAGFKEDENRRIDIAIDVPKNKMDAFHAELNRYLKIMNLLT